MPNWAKLGRVAKRAIDQRGGVDALKGDAAELQKIAKGGGSLSEKAKAAAAALKDPGREGPDGEATAPATEQAQAAAQAPPPEQPAQAPSPEQPAQVPSPEPPEQPAAESDQPA